MMSAVLIATLVGFVAAAGYVGLGWPGAAGAASFTILFLIWLRQAFRLPPPYRFEYEDEEALAECERTGDMPPMPPPPPETYVSARVEPPPPPLETVDTAEAIQPYRCEVCKRIVRSKDAIKHGAGRRCRARVKRAREALSDAQTNDGTAAADSQQDVPPEQQHVMGAGEVARDAELRTPVATDQDQRLAGPEADALPDVPARRE